MQSLLKKSSILIFLFFHGVPNPLYAGAAQAAQVLSQTVFRVPIVAPDIQSLMQIFFQNSKQHQRCDFNFLMKLINTKGITLNSHNDYLAQCAMRTVAANGLTSQKDAIVYPFLFPRECAQNNISLQSLNPSTKSASHAFEEFFSTVRGTASPQFEAQLGENKFYLEVATVNHSSVLRDRMDLHDRQVAFVQYVIEHSAEAKQLYIHDCTRNIELLKKIIGKSSQPESLVAQASVNSLELAPIYNEGEILMYDVKPQLQNLLFDKHGFKPIDTVEKQEQALTIVAPFFKAYYEHIQRPNDYIAFLEECKSSIPGAELLIQRAKGTNGLWDKLSSRVPGLSSVIPGFSYKPRDKEVENSRFLKNFVQLEGYCKAEQFRASQSILDNYLKEMRSSKDANVQIAMASELHHLSIAHTHYYSKVFNQHNIRYEHTDDPYYQASKILLASCSQNSKTELLSVMQETVQIRQTKLDNLLSLLEVKDKSSPLVRAFSYALLDAKDPKEIVQILAPLSKDHENPEYRSLYTIFYKDNAIHPKLLTINDTVKLIPMAPSLAHSQNTTTRLLYGYCGMFEAQTDQQKAILAQAVRYIDKSCESHHHAKEYLYLADKLHQSLISPDSENLILKSPDFLHDFATSEQNALKGTLLPLTVECLIKIDTIIANVHTVEVKEDLMEVLTDINEAFDHIKANKPDIAHNWIEKVISPTITAGFTQKSILDEKLQLQLLETYGIHIPKSPLLEIPLPDEELKAPPGCGTGLLPEPKVDWTCGSGEFYEEIILPIIIVGCLPETDQELKNIDNSPLNEWEERIRKEQRRGCNSSQDHGLPSFGQKDAQGKAKEVNIPHLEEKELLEVQPKENERGKDQDQTKPEDLEKELEAIGKKWKESVEDLTEEEVLVIDRFLAQVKDLIVENGLENVREALLVASVRSDKILERKKIIKLIKWLSESLKKINSNEIYKTFKYDAAHNGKVRAGSIEEALAGIACLEQRFFEKLSRSENGAEEFIDQNGQSWDVKTAKSYTFEDIYIFNPEKFIGSVKKELRGKENVIVQITDLDNEDLDILYKKLPIDLTKNELQRIIVIHANDQSKSKSSTDLIKYLEQNVSHN